MTAVAVISLAQMIALAVKTAIVMAQTNRCVKHLAVMQMPALMNCINVLVLPSLNEGMPLVTMEALNCGCNAVGSRVGGIPEILGEENTVPLGQDFTSQMAQKICEFLLEPKDQLHGRGFGWDATARIEDAAYKKILG